MATIVLAPPSAVPSHVPPDLVVESPLYARKTVYENPYETIIPQIHAGPQITYVTNIFPGKRPGWLLRRAADVRALLADTENLPSGAWVAGPKPLARIGW